VKGIDFLLKMTFFKDLFWDAVIWVQTMITITREKFNFIIMELISTCSRTVIAFYFSTYYNDVKEPDLHCFSH
jgi:hypothetical protein